MKLPGLFSVQAGGGGHRRRRPHSLPSALETLEARHLLTLIGPVLAEEAAVISTDISDHHEHDLLHETPLPRNWQPGRGLPPSARDVVLHPLTDIPVLNSYPSATVQVYLDFDGHFQEEWGNKNNITTPPFSLDNDTSTFTDAELDAIVAIFSRVAEDFSPFNVNITTAEPPDLSDGVGIRVAIGGRWEDWYGHAAGGVAYIDAFTNHQPNVVYTFSETLATPENAAEASSHEAGHAFGLNHQSSYNEQGNKTAEYYGGDSTGAPIMGLSYNTVRSRWWNGTSTSSTTMQDDLAVISRLENGFGYRVDDHANSFGTATELVFINNVAASPGVIEQMDDIDVFWFEVTTEDEYRLDFHAATVGANLDAQMELLTDTGELIDERSVFHLDSFAIGRALLPGIYQVRISNEGTYGSLGRYTLQVSQGNDPNLPPTSPAELSGTYLSPISASFSWIDALGETSYRLEASRKVGKRLESFSVEIPAESTSYVLSGYGVLDSWMFTLFAVNPTAEAASDPVVPVDIPVVAPTGITTERFSNDSLAVFWQASTGAWAYLVQLTTAADPDTVLQDVFVDGIRTATVLTGLQGGVDYLLTVTARNSVLDASSEPVAVHFEVAAPVPPVQPIAPQSLLGTAPAAFTTNLLWSASSGATLYQIQQKRGKAWITVQIVAADQVTTSLIPDGTKPMNRFRIVAGDGNSTAASKSVKIRQPAPPWRKK